MDQPNRDTILKIVENIRTSDVPNKDEHFSAKYPQFKKKYPTVFKMACDTTFDLGTLHYMLDFLQKMEYENVSQYDASASVGEMLFTKYVKPKISE